MSLICSWLDHHMTNDVTLLLAQDGDIGVTLSAPGGAIAPGERSDRGPSQCATQHSSQCETHHSIVVSMILGPLCSTE
jgi:hypothetical protein